jgi:fatty acid desaturase
LTRPSHHRGRDHIPERYFFIKKRENTVHFWEWVVDRIFVFLRFRSGRFYSNQIFQTRIFLYEYATAAVAAAAAVAAVAAAAAPAEAAAATKGPAAPASPAVVAAAAPAAVSERAAAAASTKAPAAPASADSNPDISNSNPDISARVGFWKNCSDCKYRPVPISTR